MHLSNVNRFSIFETVRPISGWSVAFLVTIQVTSIETAIETDLNIIRSLSI